MAITWGLQNNHSPSIGVHSFGELHVSSGHVVLTENQNANDIIMLGVLPAGCIFVDLELKHEIIGGMWGLAVASFLPAKDPPGWMQPSALDCIGPAMIDVSAPGRIRAEYRSAQAYKDAVDTPLPYDIYMAVLTFAGNITSFTGGRISMDTYFRPCHTDEWP